MSTQLAAKLQPYWSLFLGIQVVLLCLAILSGCYIFLRHFLGKKRAQGDAGLDNEQIALEITEEMRRLYQLRLKIMPNWTEGSELLAVPEGRLRSTNANDKVEKDQHSHEPEVLANQDGSSVPPTVVNEQLMLELEALRERTQTQSREHEARVKKLEEDLQMTKSALEAASGGGPVIGESDPELVQAELSKVRTEFEKEREDLLSKVTHLEKVLSEYRIFEEDFALVKKYKAENEHLKKQMASSNEVTEDDINNLIASVNSAPTAMSLTPEGQAQTDSFFSADMFANKGAAVEPDLNIAASPDTLTGEAPLQPQLPTSGPEAAALHNDLDALLMGGAIPAESPIVPESSETAEAKEPQSTAPTTEEDLEALAESSVDDDKLIEEFEKILGEKAQ